MNMNKNLCQNKCIVNTDKEFANNWCGNCCVYCSLKCDGCDLSPNMRTIENCPPMKEMREDK